MKQATKYWMRRGRDAAASAVHNNLSRGRRIFENLHSHCDRREQDCNCVHFRRSDSEIVRNAITAFIVEADVASFNTRKMYKILQKRNPASLSGAATGSCCDSLVEEARIGRVNMNGWA